MRFSPFSSLNSATGNNLLYSVSALQDDLSEQRIILDCIVNSQYHSNSYSSQALIDSGCQINGIDSQFAKLCNLDFTKLDRPLNVTTVDGSPIHGGQITHFVKVKLSINSHVESLDLLVTTFAKQDIILGVPWLRTHNPIIDWAKNELTFHSDCTRRGCNPVYSTPAPASSAKAIKRGKANLQCKVEKESPASSPLPEKEPSLSNPSTPLPSTLPSTCSQSSSTSDQGSSENSHIQINFVNSAAFALLAKNKENQAFLLPNHMLDQLDSINISDLSTSPPEMKDEAEYIETLKSKLLEKFHEYLDVFSKASADDLPPNRSYDHNIDTKEGSVPPFGPIYPLSEPELKEMSTFLKDNLKKGFIRPSQSPAGAPVFFIKKKDGSLKVTIDYRGLNAVTIKNRYPLPLIGESLDRLRSAKHFSKIDLRCAYNLLRIKPGDEWKTAFRTRYGHFETLVVQYGLTNAPASFQHLMNDIFRDMLDISIICYLDDILIFSENEEDHEAHIKEVLSRLRKHKLFAKAEKSEFFKTEVDFLGFIVGSGGIRMDPAKVKTVMDWPLPANLQDIQAFLGFANFYRRFIRSYSKIAVPLTRLLKKDTPFSMSEAAIKAFNKLKEAFQDAPVLNHFVPSRKIVLETDASDVALAGILSQYDEEGVLHPIAFHSRKLSPAELNYEIYDKELLAIVDSFKSWRPYLEGSEHPISVLTDHKNLEYFKTARVLTRRQARWSLLLNSHIYELKHRPGKQSTKPDAFTRRSDYTSNAKASEQLPETLLKPIRISAITAQEIYSPNSDIKERINAGIAADTFFSKIKRNLQNPPDQLSEDEAIRCSVF